MAGKRISRSSDYEQTEKAAERRKIMPVKKCSGGHKYGNKGKCYKGKGSRAKAATQGRAIHANQKRRKKR